MHVRNQVILRGLCVCQMFMESISVVVLVLETRIELYSTVGCSSP
uniref:Uncharacterized protein n=1 Tax=Nelumbo nucifera TaxID=4432 RepID=A0A822YCH9_NELNU|nr:TPA_asm: hypothetical protein HUJ06_030163 [Nelumbo nucifera]